MKTIEYLKSYGGREKYFQRVKDLRAGDCVVRACAHAIGLEYFQVMQRLFELGLEMKMMPNDKRVYEVFLVENGFSPRQSPLKRNGNKRYKVKEFPVDDSKVYVIHTSNHLTCIDQGLHKDSWNCGAWAAQSYFVK